MVTSIYMVHVVIMETFKYMYVPSFAAMRPTISKFGEWRSNLKNTSGHHGNK